MQIVEYKILDPLGIHARPAGLLVKEASAFRSDITIACGKKTADAKKIFAVMGLGAKQGDNLKFTVTGTDETDAARTIENFLKQNL